MWSKRVLFDYFCCSTEYSFPFSRFACTFSVLPAWKTPKTASNLRWKLELWNWSGALFYWLQATYHTWQHRSECRERCTQGRKPQVVDRSVGKKQMRSHIIFTIMNISYNSPSKYINAWYQYTQQKDISACIVQKILLTIYLCFPAYFFVHRSIFNCDYVFFPEDMCVCVLLHHIGNSYIGRSKFIADMKEVSRHTN